MFIGQNLFIPFFIIGIGMLIDLSLFFTDYKSLIFLISILAIAIFTKYIAAVAVRKLYNYSVAEQNLIFGLSTSHAAATIAVVVVGNRIGLFDESIMNSTIILIFVSCMVSSFVTERAAQKVSFQLADKKTPSAPTKIDRVLVPVSNPKNLNYLLDFSIVFKRSPKQIPIYPLTVISDFKKANVLMDAFHKHIDKYAIDASSTENTLNPIVKKDISVVNGILTAASQNHITKIIMGWNGRITTSNFFLGTLLENLVHKANQMIVVIKLNRPIEDFEKLRVFVSSDAEYETGFIESIEAILSLAEHNKINPTFYSSEETLKQIRNYAELKHDSSFGVYESLSNWKNMQEYPSAIGSDKEITFTILARPMSLKFNSNNDRVTRNFSRNYIEHNFGIIYPAIDENTTQIV